MKNPQNRQRNERQGNKNLTPDSFPVPHSLADHSPASPALRLLRFFAAIRHSSASLCLCASVAMLCSGCSTGIPGWMHAAWLTAAGLVFLAVRYFKRKDADAPQTLLNQARDFAARKDDAGLNAALDAAADRLRNKDPRT